MTMMPTETNTAALRFSADCLLADCLMPYLLSDSRAACWQVPFAMISCGLLMSYIKFLLKGRIEAKRELEWAVRL